LFFEVVLTAKNNCHKNSSPPVFPKPESKKMAGSKLFTTVLVLFLSQLAYGANMGRSYASSTVPASRGQNKPSAVPVIAVFGGSGRLGTEVVYQQLKKGGAVHCLVHSESSLTVPPGSGGSEVGTPMIGARVVKVIHKKKQCFQFILVFLFCFVVVVW
jgi:hypothetical protein